MKIEVHDDQAERITIKTLRRSRKFLKSAKDTTLGWPDDQELIDAMDRVLSYYK